MLPYTELRKDIAKHFIISDFTGNVTQGIEALLDIEEEGLPLTQLEGPVQLFHRGRAFAASRHVGCW